MYITRPISLVVGAALLSASAIAQTVAPSPQEFAAAVSSSDTFEIKSSELALQNSQNTAVREFAEMMIRDHTAAIEELKAAAAKDRVEVSETMAEKQAALLETLGAATAEAFDAAYLNAQVGGHEEALALLAAFAANGQTTALNAHAQKMAPIVQMHLEHVEALEDSVKR